MPGTHKMKTWGEKGRFCKNQATFGPCAQLTVQHKPVWWLASIKGAYVCLWYWAMGILGKYSEVYLHLPIAVFSYCQLFSAIRAFRPWCLFFCWLQVGVSFLWDPCEEHLRPRHPSIRGESKGDHCDSGVNRIFAVDSIYDKWSAGYLVGMSTFYKFFKIILIFVSPCMYVLLMSVIFY